MALTNPALLEALLFASGEALSKKKILTLLEISAAELEEAIGVLHEALKGHGLALIETENELELRTAPEAHELIQKMRESDLSRDLGKASLETLAMILYRGSTTRSEIDWVRGVNSGAAIRSLTLRGLIERSEDSQDKRRARYKPTVEALAHLGISRQSELPRYAEFTTLIAEHEARLPKEEAV
jgi:segregation and condensation protein B